MFYVERDGSIRDMSHLSHTWADSLPADRLYATLEGASRHEGAAPFTMIRIEANYDAREVMDNGWSVEGLTPVGHVHIVTVPSS